MIKTFAQLRRTSAKSINKTSLQKNNIDIEHLSKQFNNLTHKNIISRKYQKISHIEHCKTEESIKEWAKLPNQIIEEDQQPNQLPIPHQHQLKMLKFHKKPLITQSREDIKTIPSQTTKNLGLIISPRTALKAKIDINKNKPTQMASKRQKQKIIVRLKGIIEVVNNNQINSDNLTELITLIDKLAQKIKKN